MLPTNLRHVRSAHIFIYFLCVLFASRFPKLLTRFRSSLGAFPCPSFHVPYLISLEWTLGKWQRYYDKPPGQRKGIFNVISLEFSHTPLEGYISPPEIVSEYLDWIKHWPKRLRGPAAESALPTSPIPIGVAGKTKETLTYPKIQYYCLMGVKNCFTDFRSYLCTALDFQPHTPTKWSITLSRY